MKKQLFALFIMFACFGVRNVNAQIADSLSAFWQETKTELAKIPMEVVVEPLKAALPYHTYKITLQSLNNVKFVALLALPIQGEKVRTAPWPVIISNPGYGGMQQGIMLSECQRGFAVIQVFPRGQGESVGLYKIQGDKLTGNLAQPAGYYYQAAYADVIRTIDYVNSRKDLNSERIALVSTSQGGGISLAVAAIDQRVKTVVAHLPFLCNFKIAARTEGSLVKQLLDKEGKNNEKSFSTMAYFDPFELAPNLKIPVLMSAGGKDTTCPKATIQSVYDRLPGKKELKIYPELKHTSCLDFYQQTWKWLEHQLAD
jgi:cephalosporin-C deacetylase